MKHALLKRADNLLAMLQDHGASEMDKLTDNQRQRWNDHIATVHSIAEIPTAGNAYEYHLAHCDDIDDIMRTLSGWTDDMTVEEALEDYKDLIR